MVLRLQRELEKKNALVESLKKHVHEDRHRIDAERCPPPLLLAEGAG